MWALIILPYYPLGAYKLLLNCLFQYFSRY